MTINSPKLATPPVVDAAANTSLAAPPVRRPRLIVPILAIVAFVPFGLLSLFSALRYRHSIKVGAPSVSDAVRARDWAAYAFGTGLTVAILAAIAALVTANDGAVIKAYFNLEVLGKSIGPIANAFLSNLGVSIIAEIGTLIWALVLAIARAIPGKAFAPIRILTIAYIDLFRSLPALLTVLLIGFGLPATGISIFQGMSLFQSGAIALIVVYGAYVAEIFRTGIEAIPGGQMSAARALGFGYFGAMRHIVLPQAVRSSLPSLLNWYILILKDTSLLSVLGLLEGVTAARIQVTYLSNLTPLVGVALCFLVVTLPLSRFTDYLVTRQAKQRAGKA